MKLPLSLPLDCRVSYKAKHEIHELDLEERKWLEYQLSDCFQKPEEIFETMDDEQLLTLGREKGVIL